MPNFSWVRCALLLLILVSICAHTARAQNSTVAPNLQGARAYAPIEAAFDWPGFAGDPFDYARHDVRVSVRTPSGATVSLPAFFDGGATWRVRHSANAAGIYRVTGVFDNGHKLPLRARPQRWKVGATSKPAGQWVRLDARNARRFALSGGARFYPFGLNQAWTGAGQKDYEAKFADLQNAGLNWSRVWMNHWDGKNLDWPPDGKIQPGAIDLKTARYWDEIVRSADRHHVYLQMTIQHHGQYSLTVNPNWDDNPWNVINGGFLRAPDEFFTDARARELTKRKLRYIVARYGYSPHVMAWELWNEVQFSAAGQNKKWGEIAAWHREMADFLRAQDAYHHLITTSSDAPPAVYSSVDYYQFHAYPVHLIPVLSAPHFEDEKWPAKPEFIGEFGPDNTKDRPDEWTMHAGLWAGLMSDAAGAAQLWEGDRVEREHYYFHFAAISKLLRQSEFARHDAQSATAPASIQIQSPQKVALKFTFEGGWGAAKQSEFDLCDPDAARALGGLPNYLQGDNHRDLNPKPLQLKLDLPRPAVLKLTLKQVARVGANLRVTLGGQTVDYPFAPSADDTRLNQQIAIPVEAGPQILTLENTGRDWIVLGDLSVPDAAPALDGRVRANRNWMMGWFFARASIEAAAPPASMPASMQSLVGGTARIANLGAGDYRVIWWDTVAGRAIKTETLRADANGLQLQVPSIARDVAVWARKVN